MDLKSKVSFSEEEKTQLKQDYPKAKEVEVYFADELDENGEAKKYTFFFKPINRTQYYLSQRILMETKDIGKQREVLVKGHLINGVDYYDDGSVGLALDSFVVGMLDSVDVRIKKN